MGWGEWGNYGKEINMPTPKVSSSDVMPSDEAVLPGAPTLSCESKRTATSADVVCCEESDPGVSKTGWAPVCEHGKVKQAYVSKFLVGCVLAFGFLS